MDAGFFEWLARVAGVLRETDLRLLGWAVAWFLVSILLYSYRLYVIARVSGAAPRLGMRGALAAQLISMLVNNLTPAARAGGELARAMLVGSYGGGGGAVLNVVMFERVTEAIGVVVIVLGLILVGGERALSLILLAALLVAMVLAAGRYWRRLLAVAERRLLPRQYAERLSLSENAGLLYRMLEDKLLTLFGVAVGAGVWVLDALRLYFIAASLGYWLGVEKSLVVSMLYLAAGVLAFTPGGLGIVEGGLTAAFIAVGLPAAEAFTATLIERLLSYGLASLLGAAALALEGGRRLWRALRLR